MVNFLFVLVLELVLELQEPDHEHLVAVLFFIVAVFMITNTILPSSRLPPTCLLQLHCL